MFGFGLGEWVLILLIALLLFGPRWFVKAGSTLGESFSGFTRGLKSGQQDEPATTKALPEGREQP